MSTATQESASFCRSLPIELIHKIVADVDDRRSGDYKERIPPSLKACSLVCRAWVALSQSRIFRTLTMDYNMSSFRRHISRFNSLHLTAPHLCVYIRNLKLHFPVKRDRVSRWLPGCITQFRNVRSLHLDGSAPYKFRLMDMLSSLGILSLLPTLQLQRLELPRWRISEDASDLRCILLACPSTLQELSLEVIEQEKSRRTHSESAPSPIVHFSALRKLRLAQTSSPLPQFTFLECPNLECFTMANEGTDAWCIPQWIPAGVSHLILERLSSTSVCWLTLFLAGPAVGLPDLGAVVCPSEVTINMSPHPGDATYGEVMEWIRGCLVRLPNPIHLQQLNIIIYDPYPTPLQVRERSSEYEALCSAIQRLHGHGGLKRVNFNIIHDGSDDASMLEELCSQILEGISAEVEHGRIEICMRLV